MTPAGHKTKPQMKIKVKQLESGERSVITAALDMYVNSVFVLCPELKEKYNNIRQAVRQGELLLCEYQYNEQEEGGDE